MRLRNLEIDNKNTVRVSDMTNKIGNTYKYIANM